MSSLATIILGVIAIWLSLYFYRQSNGLFIAISTALRDITASTRTTEGMTHLDAAAKAVADADRWTAYRVKRHPDDTD